MGIHPLASVAATAVIGEGVEIGPFAVVGPEVVLGEGGEVLAHGVVLGHTTLGAGCRVFSGAVLGGEPQDLRYAGEPTRLEVGRRNVFREGVTVHRGTAEARGGRGVTVLGDDNLFMAQSHVAHDVQLGAGCVLANSVAVAGHCEIGSGATLGGLAGIHQRARVGRLAMVGAGAMVSQDVPPFCLAQGDRARLLGLNVVGLRRAGFPAATMRALKDALAVLADRALLRDQRVVRLEEMGAEVPEVMELAVFLASSRRGVCRSRGAGDGDDP
ncbi:MAG: acyl-ACP--UDP-N-acetylglucosamine O-acyltransferase [Pseudomonadota bacterium]